MIFDAYAALRKLESGTAGPAIHAIPAIPPPQERPRIAEIAGIADGREQNSEKLPDTRTSENPTNNAASPNGQTAFAPPDDPYRHGKSISGSPRTWTGKVVSLDVWRDLSEWERHGSTGKRWNGATQQWEAIP